MVREFEDRLEDTRVYLKFRHLLDALMGSLYIELMDELIREILDHVFDTL